MAETSALEVTPDSALEFTLLRGTPVSSEGRNAPSTVSDTPRCTMTLRHPGKNEKHLAFKVKTTQPRRYLVRPNQGVVAPGKIETVTILLVEKDKQSILQSYDRLGQSALDHCKDKFLVQSCVVSDDFNSRFLSEKAKASGEDGEGYKSGKELGEALTSMWNAVSNENIPICNKKLHVRHVVAASEDKTFEPAILPKSTPAENNFNIENVQNIENMSPEQVYAEVSSLRRKYDELVAFSVNLTAERDILNNTLEQTKRDLNREMAARAELENRGGGGINTFRGMPKEAASGIPLMQVIVIVLVSILAGIKGVTSGSVDFLGTIPGLGSFLGLGNIPESLGDIPESMGNIPESMGDIPESLGGTSEL